jgi:hypothetical protein
MNGVMPTPVQPALSRCSISEDFAGLRIVIPARCSLVILFLLGWLGAWTLGGITVAKSMLHHLNTFILFWMFGWAFGALGVGYVVLYMLAGRQVVLANAEGLNIRSQVFGLGPARSYLAQDIHNLRFRPRFAAGRVIHPSAIAFDHGAKTIIFAAGVDEPEAAELINSIRQRCGLPATPAWQVSDIKFR